MVSLFLSKVNSKISSDIFIRNIFHNNFYVSEDSFIIEKTKHGKPFLMNFPEIQYNISHTKGIIVCAISDENIGIDIEKIRNFNKRIPQKFFTENEQNYIFSKKEDQNKRFFEVWTRKEAYVKWVGLGLELTLNSFDVLQDTRIITEIIDDYIVSICTEQFVSSKFSKVNINWIK